MDIDSISRCIRLRPRKIRYVLDQAILAGTRGQPQTDLRGRPRHFTQAEALFLACGALMLEAGIRRGTVREVMARLAALPWPWSDAPLPLSARQRAVARPRTAMEALVAWSGESTSLSIGDGVNLRVVSGPVDTGWIEPRSRAALSETYVPFVVMAIDFKLLRDKLDVPGTE